MTEEASECRVLVDAGVCKMRTLITAREEMGLVHLDIKSDCPNVLKMSWRLQPISAYSEVEANIHASEIYALANEDIPHAACPVMAGIIKAIEVAGGLGLKRDCSIHFVGPDEVVDVK
ncbi:MAG: hypothetical protein IKR86_11825 [Candidatus Methanomethylophilaceae archaeon]|jgi:hypothetical protein|nr:hypothetical protein [Candidatus Methanomethylophilaceae archaeon]